MKPAIKIFTTLSLSMSTGVLLSISENNPKIKVAGQNLYSKGLSTTQKYPYPALKRKMVNEIEMAVESLLKQSLKPQVLLSMLIAGLIDISAKCNKNTAELISPVIEAAQDCLDILPEENIDHEEAFQKYLDWLESK